MAPEIAVLLGVGITGTVALINTAITQLSESSRQKRKEALAALESVHEALSDYGVVCVKLATHSLTVAISPVLPKIDLSEITNNTLKLEYRLILYAPEMLAQFASVKAATGDIGTRWFEVMIAHAKGQASSQMLSQIMSKAWDQKIAVEKLQGALAEYARRKYAGDFSFRWKRFLDGNGF